VFNVTVCSDCVIQCLLQSHYVFNVTVCSSCVIQGLLQSHYVLNITVTLLNLDTHYVCDTVCRYSSCM